MGGSPSRPDIVLIGYVIDPAVPEANDSDILESICSRYEGPTSVTGRLHALSGRFVLLVDGPDDSYLFHDACGLRPVYYLKTQAGLAISSDPAVQLTLGKSIWPIARVSGAPTIRRTTSSGGFRAA